MNDLKPMVALNVYLTPEFRRQILSEVLEQKDALNPETHTKLFSFLKDKLKVPGFRSPLNAPKALTIRAMEGLFEKDSHFIASILMSWTELLQSKTSKLDALLQSLGFSVRGTDEDYTDHENSFMVGWPVDVSYDTLYSKAIAQVNALDLSSDELALVTIWKTGALPGEFGSEAN